MFLAVWFLENHVEKIYVDDMLHHMLDSKKKNTILPCGKLITKISAYTDFDFEDEESKIMHSKIGKDILRKMGYTIQGR